MRTITFLLLLTLPVVAFAQNEPNRSLNWDRKVRVEYVYPIHFGNNSHAESQYPIGGLAFSFDLVELRNLRFGIGIERLLYDVSDQEMMGSMSHSNDTNLYGYLSYDVPLSSSVTVRPEIGGGYSTVDKELVSSGTPQNGYNLRGGMRIELRRKKAISFNAGLFYMHNGYGMNTLPQYEAYFKKASALHISVGINIELKQKQKQKHK